MSIHFCRWGNIEFPLPFGRVMSPTEKFIHSLDEKVSVNDVTLYIQVVQVVCSMKFSSSNRIFFYEKA